MPAVTATKRTIPFKVNTGTKAGQGTLPEVQLLMAFSDLSQEPNWVDVTPYLRDFSVSRGRESELTDMDAGTCTVTLDNRTRRFDPTVDATVHPLNRIWLRSQFSGATKSMFYGYTGSYDQQWPEPGHSDAVCVVQATDEFKNLSRARLPVTSPPRDTYDDLVLFDAPTAYWPLDAVSPQARTLEGLAGGNLNMLGTPASSTSSPVVADNSTVKSWDIQPGANFLGTDDLGASGGDGNAAGMWEFTIEGWYRVYDGLPIGTDVVVSGPFVTGGVFNSYEIQFKGGGIFCFTAYNGSADITVTSTVAVPSPSSGTYSSWYHVVGVSRGGYLRLYLNGVEVGNTSWSWTIPNSADPSTFNLGNATGGGSNFRTYSYSNVAFYPYGLGTDRILAHYQAASLGFPPGQTPGDPTVPSLNGRVSAVLDAVNNHAPRSIQSGTTPMRGVYQHGQPPLDELRQAQLAEAPDGALFVTADGTVKFLNNDHNNNSPYDTVQVTFGDEGGTEIPYTDVDVDYSDSFLVNVWNITRTDGQTQTRRDQDSIDRYWESSESLTDVPVTTDWYAGLIADNLVYRYSKPQLRVLSLETVCEDPNVSFAVLPLELLDRVRLIRTKPKNGGWIDRQLFIEKIEIQGANDGAPWQIRFGVTDAAFVYQGITSKFADFNALTAAYPSFDDMRITTN